MNPNLAAFLAVVRYGEGTAGENGYQKMVGGHLITSFADHPRLKIIIRYRKKTIVSTAAGAYQILARTWDECAKALRLPDFSPASQDRAAIYLIKRRGAFRDVLDGRIYTAIRKCNREWASLPGSPYGQPTLKIGAAIDLYRRAGGTLTEDKSKWPSF
jgi:muramidase (phage lysozyme)